MRIDATRTATNVTEPLGVTPAAHALVKRVHVEVVDGADTGAKHSSTTERTTIGTDRASSFVLTDPTVSRFHCEIAVEANGVFVRDLGSKNGTRIGSALVREARITDDVVMTLGRTKLRVSFGDNDVRIPLSTATRFGRMVGASQAMRAVFAVLERAAQTDLTVLLHGETGTGKELAAEALHEESRRAHGPFVPLDCGAIPGALLESELFGHNRGAFTGAEARRTGAFVDASGGTLFLDEVGELGKDLQPKFLRALESRKIRAVGGSQLVPVDVRIVAASNRDLRAEVSAGTFRADLLYRLAVIEVRLPPLRERLEDLPLIVDEILRTTSGLEHRIASRLRAPEEIERLARHSWPGNVRELRNHVERCLGLGEPLPVDVQAPSSSSVGSAGAAIDTKEPLRAARERHVRDFERRYLEQLLKDHGDNVAAAARAAGIDRVHMHRLLSRAKLR
jgi:two-component system, NtrC family, response regulator GlrR